MKKNGPKKPFTTKPSYQIEKSLRGMQFEESKVELDFTRALARVIIQFLLEYYLHKC